MEEFINLLIKFEGLHRVGPDGKVYPYPDCVGITTIGIGTIKFDPSTTPWTVEQCRAEAISESLQKLSVLLKCSPILSTCHEAIKWAVLSWTYNLGLGAYKSSTFKRRIDNGDWEGAAQECVKWCNAGGKKVKGLIIRRGVEAMMIRSGKMPSV